MAKTYHLHHLCLLLISCELTAICPPAGAREPTEIHGFCFRCCGGSGVGEKRLKILDARKVLPRPYFGHKSVTCFLRVLFLVWRGRGGWGSENPQG